MKTKTVFIFLLILTMLCLAACGAEAPSSEPDIPSQAPVTETGSPASPLPSMDSVLPGSDLEPDTAENDPVETVTYDEASFLAAQDCIGKSVAELYEAIGEPHGSSYAPSCLDPDGDGEDGELYYDGFTVATFRKGDSEIVWDVNVNAG